MPRIFGVVSEVVMAITTQWGVHPYCRHPYPKVSHMLLLTAILRVWLPREPAANDLLAETRLRLGHVGLTIIALVFILVTYWQR